MTLTDSIHQALRGLAVGGTSAIFGVVVTRWGDDCFELNTWGGNCLDLWLAAADIYRRQP